MKFNIKKVVIIMLIFVLLEMAYLIGFYSTNKEAYSNSEEEIAAEISDSNSEMDSEIPIENSESDSDLTNSEDCVIIIEDDESTEEVQDDEEENENFDSDFECTYPKPDYDFDNMSDEQIILSEREVDCIDYLALIDSYEAGNWYCYYLYADGDCYVATIKNGHVDMFVQLN